jgi:hypothetical protein
MDFFCVENTIL